MASGAKLFDHISSNQPLSNIFVHSFIFAQKTAPMNLIFGVIEYNGQIEDEQALVSLGSRAAEYYLQDSVWDDNVDSQMQELQFENALQKLNNRVSSLIGSSQFFDPKGLRVVIGTMTEETGGKKFKVCLSQCGTGNRAMVFHKSEDGRCRPIEIIGGREAGQPINPLKTFSQLMTGYLTSADQILISNQPLFDVLSIEEIKTTVTSLPMTSALEQFRTQVSAANLPFAGLLVRLPAPSTFKPVPDKKHSLHKLLDTEKQTQKFLTPSLKINLADVTQTWLAGGGRLVKTLASNISAWRNKRPAAKESFRNEDPVNPVNQARQPFKVFSGYSAKILSKENLQKTSASAAKISLAAIGIANRSIVKGSGIIFASSKQTGRTVVGFSKKIVGGVKNLGNKIISWFKGLPPRHKITLGGGILLVLIFAQSVIWISHAQASARDEKDYQSKVAAVQDKIDHAEAAIIFKEEDGARTTLNEAENLLKLLPQNGSGRKDKFNQLTVEIGAKRDQLQHLVKISAPQVLIHLSNSNSTKIAYLDGKIIAVGNQPNASVIDTATSKVDNLDSIPSSTKSWLGVGPGDKKIYLFDQDKKLVVYHTDTGTSEQKATPLRPGYNIKDMAFYEDRLYVLESNAPQIYRFAQVKGGFAGEAVPWIKANANILKDYSSFTIDSAVYLLKSSGEINKFNNGKPVNPGFVNPSIEPPVQNATRIFTATDAPNLYVLDPATKRILVVAKTGGLVTQYYSDKFDNLKDGALDLPNKKLYILNGSDIFVIDLAATTS